MGKKKAKGKGKAKKKAKEARPDLTSTEGILAFLGKAAVSSSAQNIRIHDADLPTKLGTLISPIKALRILFSVSQTCLLTSSL